MANGFGRGYQLKPHRTGAASVFWCSHPRQDVTAVARHPHRSSPLLRPRRSLTLAKADVDAHRGVVKPATRSQTRLQSAVSTWAALWLEHITNGTAIIKSAFARLRSVAIPLAYDSRKAGRGLLQILFAADARSSRFLHPNPTLKRLSTNPWSCSPLSPNLIRCPLFTFVRDTSLCE
jgi:hypothetical protein